MQKVANWFLKYRYLLLCLLVFGLLALRTDNTFVVGDFWEHSSVVRELATHPLNPQHPQLLLNAPHAFNTPYHLILGLASRFSGRSAVEVLSIAGLVNLALYFCGFYLFISTLDWKNRSGLAFYALLLTLLLWGFYAWNFSGFYHLRNLGYIIPYPSMFAMALSLFSLWMNGRRLKNKNDWWLIPIGLGASTVLLTHSITFFFLAAGLAAMTLRVLVIVTKLREAAPAPVIASDLSEAIPISHQSSQLRKAWLLEVAKIAGLLVFAFGLATLWPYYPFLDLMAGASAVYHASNQDMYNHIFLRTWPLLVGIPLMINEARKDWRSPLPWMFTALLGVYMLGWVTGAYSYGRAISYLGFILQIVIAIYLVKIELWVAARADRPAIWQTVFSLGFTLLLVLLTLTSQVIPLAETLKPIEGNHLEKYLFLAQYTDQYDVILTDLPTSMVVPTFGGKVVAFDRPMPFVTDAPQRRADVLQFYDPQTSIEERQSILEKYKVKYILLEKKPEADWEATRQIIAPFGDLIYRGKRFLLYKVNP
jgi:hypothetical protein